MRPTWRTTTGLRWSLPRHSALRPGLLPDSAASPAPLARRRGNRAGELPGPQALGQAAAQPDMTGADNRRSRDDLPTCTVNSSRGQAQPPASVSQRAYAVAGTRSGTSPAVASAMARLALTAETGS